jgi:polar amino acid transport system substrate-binding protein
MIKYLVILTLSLFSISAKADKPKLIFAADYWCPWNCESKDLPGFAIEIAKAIYEPMGYEVSFSEVPWTRAIEQAKAGNINVLIGVDSGDPLSKGIIFPQEPIGVNIDVYAVKSDSNFHYLNDKSFDGKKIGIVSGYHYTTGDIGNYIEKNYNDPTKIVFNYGIDAAKKNLMSLLTDKVDLFVDDYYVVEYLIKNQNATGKAKIAGTLDDKTLLYFGYSPAIGYSKMLADAYDEGIKKLKQDGTYDKIMKKYLPNIINSNSDLHLKF